VDLDMVRSRIPWLRGLGVSHIYLSPLFSAATGSTHGYDVIDPNRVDPVLGGAEAFHALSAAARKAGLGVILDIVPNHMAFTPENPHVADVMRFGRESRFAPLFDIDWQRGPLHFPVLDANPEDLLRAGHIAFSGTTDEPALSIYDRRYPLRRCEATDQLAAGTALDEAELARLLDSQHWTIGHWHRSADRIVHRRFFNVTDLIGVRQEDPEVFDFTHRWIIEQVRAGRVQGLRVDHIDGLARPGAYLHRLREAVGFVPIWVEKIVKEGEELPHGWAVEGMSGYEFMAPVTQLLTQPGGLARLRVAAKAHVPEDYAAEVRRIRRTLLRTVFTPELLRVTDAALSALAANRIEAAAVRAAIIQLALHWPVYRSYAADRVPPGTRCTEALEAARNDHLPSDMLGPVFSLLSAPDDALAREFATRFEQLTGALTAKSEEDTAFYRAVAFLPFCEVGAQPDLEPLDAAAFVERMRARAQTSPCALNALSTHDTKRSADARAAIMALTWLPALGERLYGEAVERARAHGIAARWGVYALQCALMLQAEADAEPRLTEHVSKAMRESKDASSHEQPDHAAEEATSDLALSLLHSLRGDGLWSPAERDDYARIWHELILVQLALQLTAPGIPDIYQGTEACAVALTDPDNRREIAWDRMEASVDTLDARKLALTRDLLARRRQDPELFAMGSYDLEPVPGAWRIHRTWQGRHEAIDIARPEPAPPLSHEDDTGQSRTKGENDGKRAATEDQSAGL